MDVGYTDANGKFQNLGTITLDHTDPPQVRPVAVSDAMLEIQNVLSTNLAGQATVTIAGTSMLIATVPGKPPIQGVSLKFHDGILMKEDGTAWKAFKFGTTAVPGSPAMECNLPEKLQGKIPVSITGS